MIRTTTLWTAAAIAAFSVCPGTTAAAAVPAHRTDPVPAVWPAPQSIRPWSHGSARAGRERELLGRQRDALAKISQRIAVGVLDPFLDKADKTQGDER